MARTRTGGWYDFAGALLGIAGALHGFAGLMGLIKPEYTTAAPPFLDLTTWAWTWLVLGVLQLVAAGMLLGGGGRGFGIAVTILSAVLVFMSYRVYPHDGTLVILIDLLIIYGLSVHRPTGEGQAFPPPSHELDRSTPPPIH